jgi:hypothetical protein
MNNLKAVLYKLRQLTGVPEIENFATFMVEVAGEKKPDPRLKAATNRGLDIQKQLKTAEGGSYSLNETADLLNMSKQGVSKRRKTGKLFAWKEEKMAELRFPKWQFQDGRVLPGIGDVLRKLSSSNDVDILLFFLSQNRFLGGKRPLDLLRAGEVSVVSRAAEGYGE